MCGKIKSGKGHKTSTIVSMTFAVPSAR